MALGDDGAAALNATGVVMAIAELAGGVIVLSTKDRFRLGLKKVGVGVGAWVGGVGGWCLYVMCLCDEQNNHSHNTRASSTESAHEEGEREGEEGQEERREKEEKRRGKRRKERREERREERR